MRSIKHRSTIDYTVTTATAQLSSPLIRTAVVFSAIQRHALTAVEKDTLIVLVQQVMRRKMSGLPWTRTDLSTAPDAVE
jgi:hypothetical protein